MPRINAGSVIADMKNLHTIGDRAVNAHPRNTMSEIVFAGRSSYPVAARVPMTNPFPARTRRRAVYSRPELSSLHA